jgi:hypothetical protein
MNKIYSAVVSGVLFCGCNSATRNGETAGSNPASAETFHEKGYSANTDSVESDIYFVLSANYNPYSNTIVYKQNWALAAITTIYGREERNVRQSPTSYVILNKAEGHWVIKKDNLTTIAPDDLLSQGISNSDAKFLLSALEKASKSPN